MLRYTYINAVLESGGVPVLLPPNQSEEALQRYVKTLDGLMLTGGDDIPPSAYGEKPHPTTNLMAEQRYKFESRLISLWLDTGKPILGVCLGMQFTNVVSGGTMIMTAEERGMVAVKAIDDYLQETGDRLPSGRVLNFQT